MIQQIQGWFSLGHIGRVEQTYQARMLRQRRGWFGWLWRRTVDLALIVAIFLALLSAVGTLLWVNIQPFLDTIPLILIFPPIVAVLVHFGLIIRVLAYSSNSIARERQQQSWDLLVLTGVDARQIVMGKWVATVRSLWPQLLRLAVLRACVVVYVGLAINNPLSWSSAFPDEYQLFTPTVVHMALAIGFIVVATAANFWFTAACGVAASARHRSAGIALARGIGIRLGFIGVSVSGAVVFAFLFTQPLSLGGPATRFVAELLGSVLGALASLLDNGATLGATYLTTHIGEPDNRLQGYQVLAMVSLVLLYLGLTRLLLGRTVRYLVRQGALPPPSRRAVSQRAPLESTPSPMV